MEDNPITVVDAAKSPVRIKATSISHAYMAVTHENLEHLEKLGDAIAALNRDIHPEIWNVPFKAKFVAFSLDENEEKPGDVDPLFIRPALEESGVSRPYSVVINLLTAHLAAGDVKMMTGFAFPDADERIILATERGSVLPTFLPEPLPVWASLLILVMAVIGPLLGVVTGSGPIGAGASAAGMAGIVLFLLGMSEAYIRSAAP